MPDRLPAMAAALFGLAEKGVLRPRIADIFQLDRVADAHRLLESGESAGSIVLRV